MWFRAPSLQLEASSLLSASSPSSSWTRPPPAQLTKNPNPPWPYPLSLPPSLSPNVGVPARGTRGPWLPWRRGWAALWARRRWRRCGPARGGGGRRPPRARSRRGVAERWGAPEGSDGSPRGAGGDWSRWGATRPSRRSPPGRRRPRRSSSTRRRWDMARHGRRA